MTHLKNGNTALRTQRYNDAIVHYLAAWETWHTRHAGYAEGTGLAGSTGHPGPRSGGAASGFGAAQGVSSTQKTGTTQKAEAVQKAGSTQEAESTQEVRATHEAIARVTDATKDEVTNGLDSNINSRLPHVAKSRLYKSRLYLESSIINNIRMAGRRYRAQRLATSAPLRVAVASASLSHNAAGRAYTLAQIYDSFCEVEIFGPIFTRQSHGKTGEIWEPLRGATLPIYPLVISDESRFLEQALQWVAAHPYDVVHLSKPRAANIFFGILYKLLWNATVLMDVDDEELAFINATSPMHLDEFVQCVPVITSEHHPIPQDSLLQDSLLQNLHGKLWTRLAVGLVQTFDGVTVSNPALQQRYGGTILRHARDEAQFKPSFERRQQSRQRLGIPLDSRVVLFFGTPRKHKGLLEVAQALSALASPSLFLVVGDFPTTDLQPLERALKKLQNVDIRFLGNQPFASAPDIVAAGDICVLLQDPEALVSQFQVPAKLSDALAMGLTVLAEPTPALQDLAAAGAFRPVTRETLVATLAQVFAEMPPVDVARPLNEAAKPRDEAAKPMDGVRQMDGVKPPGAVKPLDMVKPVSSPVFTQMLSISANRDVLQGLLVSLAVLPSPPSPPCTPSLPNPPGLPRSPRPSGPPSPYTSTALSLAHSLPLARSLPLDSSLQALLGHLSGRIALGDLLFALATEQNS